MIPAQPLYRPDMLLAPLYASPRFNSKVGKVGMQSGLKVQEVYNKTKVTIIIITTGSLKTVSI